MPMVPVRGNDVVVFRQQRDRPHSDRFLAGIQMQEAAHFPPLVIFHGHLLEPADAPHFAQKLDFLLRRERLVDRSLGISRRL